MPRDGILGHQFNNRLEYFDPYYLQSLLLADLKENHPSSQVLKIPTKNPRNKNT
jgi:hypothetical protein